MANAINKKNASKYLGSAEKVRPRRRGGAK